MLNAFCHRMSIISDTASNLHCSCAALKFDVCCVQYDWEFIPNVWESVYDGIMIGHISHYEWHVPLTAKLLILHPKIIKLF